MIGKLQRRREAIMVLAQRIHERNKWGMDDKASWEKAYAQAVIIADRVDMKERIKTGGH